MKATGTYKFPCGCQFPSVGPPAYAGGPPLLKIDIETVEFCDKVAELFRAGRTKGVFQLEEYLGQKWAKEIQPTTMEHLSALAALLRPGSLKSKGEDGLSMTEHYALRKLGHEEVPSLHAVVDAVLQDTYGIITYQEQATKLAEVVAGFSKTDADSLRKAIGKKLAEEMEKVKVKFLEGAIAAAVIPESLAVQLFEWIEKSARYSFNKSHSYSYGTMSLWTAWAKAHMPVEFFANWIMHAKEKAKKRGDDEEISILIDDTKLFDVRVAAPDLLNGAVDSAIAADGTIFVGVCDLAYVNKVTAKKTFKLIKSTAEALQVSVADLPWEAILLKVIPELTAKAAESIVGGGATRSFGGGKVSRRRQVYEMEVVNRLKKKSVFEWVAKNWKLGDSLADVLKIAAATKKNGGACATSTQVQELKDEILQLLHPPQSLVDTPRWICDSEIKYIGAALSHGRLDGCDLSGRTTTIQKLMSGDFAPVERLGVNIRNLRIFKTKKGRDMAWMTAGDETAVLNDLVVFPDSLALHRHLLRKDNVVQLEVEPARKGGGWVVTKVWQL